MNIVWKSPNSDEDLVKNENFYLSKDEESFPIINGIPRFVKQSNYTDGFGMQWNYFCKTQLDSYSEFSLSEQRLRRCLGKDIFIKRVDLNFAMELDTSQYTLSLRHSKHLNYSYTSDTKQTPPPLSPFDESNKLQVFEWFICGNEWSDPWSLDGHILSTAEIQILTRVCNFSAPNSYESELKAFNSIFNDRKGLCYHESKVLNMPINKVQKEFDNISGSISTDYLLKMWIDGYIIDTNFLKDLTPNSTHEVHNIEFIKRKVLTSINLNDLE